MIFSLKNSSKYQIMRSTLVLALCLYALVVTTLLVRLNPKPLVIGIDAYGTRVLGESDDPILKLEKIAFLKQFLNYSYNYDETNFDQRMSFLGDMMGSHLWEREKPQFLAISEKLKIEPLTETGKIIDIREIDETHFEADVEVDIKARLKQTKTHIRMKLEITKSPRTLTKPYPYEVSDTDEQVGS